MENSQENVLPTSHSSPQAPGAAPQFSSGMGWGKAVSPPRVG